MNSLWLIFRPGLFRSDPGCLILNLREPPRHRPKRRPLPPLLGKEGSLKINAMCLPKAPPITQMSVDKDRLQAQTGRNGLVQRQRTLLSRYDLARRTMENDLDMKTACEMSAKITDGGSVENRMIARLTPFFSGQLPIGGEFKIVTVVNGVTVTVRGFVNDGVPIINTMF